ncbi:MAG: hypothetical protein WBA38_16565 [Gordonia sp. (in: high G+C Gram-positive bacteria)]|uniref:hypothetical protein n=1 Tax=Gordonia sp. (in: high G+C Gram-positive bacteria) TaxID=84139 RepID=UPI003C724C83
MGFVLALIVLLIVGLFGSAYALSFAARRQKDVVVMARPDDVIAVIESAFGGGMLWREVYGRGAWNFECRGMGISSMSISTKPVISIDASDHGPAGVLVSMWMSEYGSAWGQVGCADRVVFKRLKVERALKAISMGMPQQGVPQQGMPQQGMPQQGMPQQGMPQQGMPQQGHPAMGQQYGIMPSPGPHSGQTANQNPGPTFGPGAGTPGGSQPHRPSFSPPSNHPYGPRR